MTHDAAKRLLMRRNFDPARRQELEAELVGLRRQGLSLDEICARDGWPTRPTLRKWLRENPALAAAADHGRDAFRRHGEPHPYDPEAAARFLERVRFREPIDRLVREPDLPHRRALQAWIRARPDFAAALAEAKAHADHHRRRDRPRRATMPYSEPVADRIILALVKGATLPQLYADPTLPTRTGLRRWRRADPAFDAALRAATRVGCRARGRARRNTACTPALTDWIEQRLIAGHSLASLARLYRTPSLTSLYQWVRERPDFARAVASASEFRDWLLEERAFEHGMALAEAPAAALRQRLGQLNPHPGARRRGPV